MTSQPGRTRSRVAFRVFVAAVLLVALAAGGLVVLASYLTPEIPPFTEPDRPAHERVGEDLEPAPLPPMDLFRDVTAESGVDFTYRNGEEAGHLTLLESLGGGVALLDFDGDGLLDIFLAGGGSFGGDDRRRVRGHPCRLYKNLGGLRFRDVTAGAGLGGIDFYSHGCAAADYDRDGHPDLLVTGYGRLALFHNEPDGRGGRKFVEVTAAAGLSDPHWNTSAAWADLDGDGYPDLYVCRYVEWSWETHKTCPGDVVGVSADVCPPLHFRGAAHAVFRNNRDGTFADVSREAGLRREPAEAGRGLGVVVVDVNGDGRPDVYAVNDKTMNFLYLNESRPGTIRLRDVSLESGAAMGDSGRPDGSMGVDAADYDGTGRPSLWVTTFELERHALYQNRTEGGRAAFRYATRESGVAALGSGYVGFGTGFLDLDADGWEDLVLVNGHVRRYPGRSPLRQRAVLLRNGGTGRFANMTAQGGPYFRAAHRGRGLAIGDLDNDGRPDLVITHLNEPAAVLRNDPTDPGVARRHWLGIELAGRDSRDVTGAKVVVEAGGRKLTRFAKGGGSYLSSGDRRIVVGLGDADRVGRVSVAWPWGGEQHWDNLTAGRYWRLAEGEPGTRR